MLYVLLDFGHDLTKDALLDSGAKISPIGENQLEKINQLAPNNFFKTADPPNFKIQVVNDHLEEPIGIFTLEFDIGGNGITEHFVVMKKQTGPSVGLHSMRRNSVVSHITHGLVHFLHLTMQVKGANSKKKQNPKLFSAMTN